MSQGVYSLVVGAVVLGYKAVSGIAANGFTTLTGVELGVSQDVNSDS